MSFVIVVVVVLILSKPALFYNLFEKAWKTLINHEYTSDQVLCHEAQMMAIGQRECRNFVEEMDMVQVLGKGVGRWRAEGRRLNTLRTLFLPFR